MFVNNKSKVNLPIRQYHEHMYLARSQSYHLTFFSLMFLITVFNHYMSKDMSPVRKDTPKNRKYTDKQIVIDKTTSIYIYNFKYKVLIL